MKMRTIIVVTGLAWVTMLSTIYALEQAMSGSPVTGPSWEVIASIVGTMFLSLLVWLIKGNFRRQQWQSGKIRILLQYTQKMLDAHKIPYEPEDFR